MSHVQIVDFFGNAAISRLHGGETLGVLGCAGLDDRSEDARKEKLADQSAEKWLRWSDGNRQATRRPGARAQCGEPDRIDRQKAARRPCVPAFCRSILS